MLLVGGLEHVLRFHSVGNGIIPTDELIFFSNGLLMFMQNHILLIFDIIYTTTALLGYTPY